VIAVAVTIPLAWLVVIREEVFRLAVRGVVFDLVE